MDIISYQHSLALTNKKPLHTKRKKETLQQLNKL